ncbi:MAG TPA: hypothetical protein VMM12_01000 [Longimicrobiales bacterium]|nr:hypothetical protein [Longimicrobiales bacterium]
MSALAAAAACAPERPPVAPSPGEIETTLFLIGDAGAPDPRDVGAPLEELARYAAEAPERTVIVFLGDNAYPYGIPPEDDPSRADARRRLEAQIVSVPHGVRGVFLPGNADWDKAGVFGLAAIRLQERLIAELAGGRDVRMLPGDGCPGPVSFDVGRLRVIGLDTQWWLHDYVVADEASDCHTDVGAITNALREQVRSPDREDRVVVVTGHHPLRTGGPHGGYCGPTAPFRRFGGRSQDIISRANRTMRDSIESAMSARPPLVYAAGHDHNLQVLRGGPSVEYVLVSGAGAYSKADCVVHMRETHFASQNRSGFMRLDLLRGGGVLLRVYDYDGGGRGGLAYTRWLEPR